MYVVARSACCLWSLFGSRVLSRVLRIARMILLPLCLLCSSRGLKSIPHLPESYTCDQLAAWIRALGAREFDEEITENAEAWAKVLFFEQKLKCGFRKPI